MINLHDALKVAIEAAKKAREEILRVYKLDFEVMIKEDDSPVTIADQHADTIIREVIHSYYPNHSFLTEEEEDDLSRLNSDYVWIVDPVDGTKDFVSKDDEFTTNIALCYKHEIVLGVVLIPVSGEIYYAIKGEGSYYIDSQGNTSRNYVNDKTTDLILLTSKHHVTDAELEYFSTHRDVIGSKEQYGSAIKACRIARGLAELQLRFGKGTKEWDTAASQIVVIEAGGVFVTPSGEVMKYNRENVHNLEGFFVANKKENLPL